MLPSRGLLRSSPVLGLTRTALPKTPTRLPSRQFGTALRSNNGAALYGASTTRRVAGSLAATAAAQQLLFSLRQSRNASTQSSIPPTATPATDPATLADVTATPVSLTGSDLLDIPEQIGFLKTLGLDYGWGPTSLMQTVLESVYVYTGLPWWASIGLVALGIRAALFKPSLDASDNQLRYQELLRDPKYAAATEEMKRMLVTGNHLAGAEARARVSLMNKAAGYSLWKTFIPMLQLPLGFGMFRLLNGMSSLPVPSLETGGVLWFTDLAASDPFFILPIVAGIAMVSGMRIPLPYMPLQQQKTMKIMSLVMMPISIVFTLFLPSGIQFYFLVSSVLHWAQAWLTYQPWFRRMVGLKPLAKPNEQAVGQMSWQAPRVVDVSAPRIAGVQQPGPSTTGPESMFSSLKSTIQDAREKLNERADRGSQERAHKAAREYDEKRALEERERIVARLQQKKIKDGRY
ncbi:hypothetical protein VTI74DRAFT_4846 [Chaetomium olivicolor]